MPVKSMVVDAGVNGTPTVKTAFFHICVDNNDLYMWYELCDVFDKKPW